MSRLDGTRIEISNMQDDYMRLCRLVVDHGDRVSPRGQLTHELLGVTLVHRTPWDSLPQHIGRGLNPRLAALEALQLVAGVSYPRAMVKVAPNTAQFRDDDGSFHGAYGPRVGPAMAEVVARLKNDPDTRQAVVNIWDSKLDGLEGGARDLPCTLSLHFMIRRGFLQLHTTMRSNDVWWGTAYDVFMFTHLQRIVANYLRVACGSYFHHANSLHAYARDFDAMDALHEPTREADRPGLYTGNCRDWTDVRDVARGIIERGDASRTDGGEWWLRQAASWRDATSMNIGDNAPG